MSDSKARTFVLAAVVAGFVFGFGLGVFSNVSGAVLALYGFLGGMIVAVVGVLVRRRR